MANHSDDAVQLQMASHSDDVGYNKPLPPTVRKGKVFHLWKSTDLDERARKAPSNLISDYNKLISHLTDGLTKDLDKVRVIFVWMSRQNFITQTFNCKPDETTPAGFLSLIVQKERNLSDFFVNLCSKVGIQGKVLHGFCKEEHGPKPNEELVDSNWSVVFVDGHWRFVHLNLAFRNIQVRESPDIRIEYCGDSVGERVASVEGEIDESYFLPNPDDFIYKCWSSEVDWQLLEKPWNFITFINAPAKREEIVPEVIHVYPPPSPPKGRREDILKLQDFKDIDKQARETPFEAYHDYDALFEYLFNGLTSDIQKVRAIFVFIIINRNEYMYKKFYNYISYSDDMDIHKPFYALKLSRDRGLSLEELFAVFCREACIPCVLVRGYVKRDNKYQGLVSSMPSEDVWNAVYIDKNWRLINLYNAIFEDKTERSILTDVSGKTDIQSTRNVTELEANSINEFFFLTDPDQFVHFCLPDNAHWQLLKEPVEKSTFFNELWLYPAYFQSPWKLTESSKAMINAPNGVCQFTFDKVPAEESNIIYSLYFQEKDPTRNFPIHLQKEDYVRFSTANKNTVIIQLPVDGMYVLHFKDKNKKTLFELQIRCIMEKEKLERVSEDKTSRLPSALKMSINIGDLPLPKPPVGKRCRLFKSSTFQDQRAQNAPENLSKNYEDLLNYLKKDTSNDMEKVRALFIWMSKQNFITPRTSHYKDATTPSGLMNLVTLKELRLSDAFAYMCGMMGIHCKIINGYCKCISSNKPASATINSDWTAVYVNGHWRFVHLDLAFRNLMLEEFPEDIILVECNIKLGRRREIIEGILDDAYFFPNPDIFIYKCRPDQDEWQLLETEPWDWHTFINAPLEQQLTVPDTMPEDPPPCPPTGRKIDILRLEDFKELDAHAINTPQNLHCCIEELYDYLLKDLHSDIRKVRAIFCWLKHVMPVCIYEIPYVKPDEDKFLKNILYLRRLGKLSLEQCFAFLCRKANIPCVLVRGRMKRDDIYTVGQRDLPKNSEKGVWNAVFVDGNWRLINTYNAMFQIKSDEYILTFADGSTRTDSKQSTKKEVNEFYFLTNPDEFVHLCLPDDPRWQLLDTPRTEKQFWDEAWFRPAYFSSLWRLPDDQMAIVETHKGKCQITFHKTPEKTSKLLYDLLFKEKESGRRFPLNMHLGHYIQRSNDSPGYSVITRFPVKGTYLFKLISETDTTLCDFKVICTEESTPFPAASERGYGYTKEAESEGLNEISCKKGIINAQSGEKVRLVFKFKHKMNSMHHEQDAPLVASAGEKTQPKFKRDRQNTRDKRDQKQFDASLVGVTGHNLVPVLSSHIVPGINEDILNVDVKLPFKTNSSDFALTINKLSEKDDAQSTNVINYLFSSPSSFQGAQSKDTSNVAKMMLKHHIERELTSSAQHNDIQHLETVIRESREMRMKDTSGDKQLKGQYRLLELYEKACLQALESDSLEDLEAALKSADKSEIAYYARRRPWYIQTEARYKLKRRQSLVNADKQRRQTGKQRKVSVPKKT